MACVAAAACAAAVAADKPVMTWMVVDNPAGSIPVGGKLTDGFYDTAILLLMQEWPEVDHRVTVVNPARALALLVAGGPQCLTGVVRSQERDRAGYFTASHLLPPLKLVTKPAKAPAFARNANGEVMPANLFDRADLRGALYGSRSFGPVIDTLLALRPDSSGVQPVPTMDGGLNILRMMKLDRVDYTLAYEHNLSYQLQRNPQDFKANTFVALPLAGTEPVLAGMYCPRTEWGRDAVLKIDTLLAKVSRLPAYREAMHRWLSPETQRRHQPAEAAFYAQRAKPTDPAQLLP